MRSKDQRFARAMRIALVGMAGEALSACATPLMHPLRAHNGPFFEVAQGAAIAPAIVCGLGCPAGYVPEPSYRRAVVGPTVPAVSAGYSRILARNVGLMGGAYIAGNGIQRSIPWSFVTAFAYTTLQNDWGAVGMGPEIEPGAVAWMVGGEVRARSAEFDGLSLGLWSRLSLPFRPLPETMPFRIGSAIDLGLRLTYSAFVVQTQWWHQLQGYGEYGFYFEGVSFAQDIVTLTVGASLR